MVKISRRIMSTSTRLSTEPPTRISRIRGLEARLGGQISTLLGGRISPRLGGWISTWLVLLWSLLVIFLLRSWEHVLELLKQFVFLFALKRSWYTEPATAILSLALLASWDGYNFTEFLNRLDGLVKSLNYTFHTKPHDYAANGPIPTYRKPRKFKITAWYKLKLSALYLLNFPVFSWAPLN